MAISCYCRLRLGPMLSLRPANFECPLPHCTYIHLYIISLLSSHPSCFSILYNQVHLPNKFRPTLLLNRRAREGLSGCESECSDQGIVFLHCAECDATEHAFVSSDVYSAQRLHHYSEDPILSDASSNHSGGYVCWWHTLMCTSFICVLDEARRVVLSKFDHKVKPYGSYSPCPPNARS